MDRRKSSRVSTVAGARASTTPEPNKLSRRRSKRTITPSATPSRRSERARTERVSMVALRHFQESSEEFVSPSPEVMPQKIIRIPASKKAVKRKSSESEGRNEGEEEEEHIPPLTPTASNNTTPGRRKRKQETETTENEEVPTVRRSNRAPKPLPKWETASKSTAAKENAETPRSARSKKATDSEAEVTPRKSSRQPRNASVRNKEVSETPKTPKSLRRAKEKEAEEAIATPRSSRRSAANKSVVNAALEEGQKALTSPAKKTAPVEIQGTKLEWKFKVYGIPKCPLPCREDQFEEIWKFIFENISEKNSGCMYVSGVPGTGKTVIVQAVIDTMLKINAEKKKDLDFKYLYINGLTLASPDKIWKRMFKGLELESQHKGISTKEALKRLDSYFETHQRNPVVLVVDELDQILDKQQSILYQLLEWSSHAKHMFSFVAIFNTMSLPEHGLAMRNYSRMGFKRAVFPPYNFEQLQTIVINMLSTFKTVRLNSESISLLSRKVAAISGDARRALEIARRAMEIAESSNSSGIQAVSNAFKEIFSSAKIETIKHTSLLEQLVLKTICDEVRCSGIDEVLTAKIYDSVIPKAVYEGMQWPKDEILKALMRLVVMRLVIVEDNCTSLHKRVLLKVPVEDVNFALGIHNTQT